MRLMAAMVAVVVLAGCGSNGELPDSPAQVTDTGQSEREPQTLTLSEAFCNDLEAGVTPFQIYQGVSDQYEPAKFADLAYGFAAIDCPDELVGNEALRTYLDAWSIDPDA